MTNIVHRAFVGLLPYLECNVVNGEHYAGAGEAGGTVPLLKQWGYAGRLQRTIDSDS